MQFTICEICGKTFGMRLFHAGEGGEALRFADYEAPLSDFIGAHPHGLRWICETHLQAALKRIDENSDDAIRKLKAELGYPEDAPTLPELEEPELWVTAIGPNVAQVFSLLRRARDLNLAEANAEMKKKRFRVAVGGPHEFESFEEKLTGAGASVEVRFLPWDDIGE